MKNEISRIIVSESFSKIEQCISELEQELAFCANLPEEEKRGGFKLGDKNLGFLVKARDYINQNPDFMPSYVSIEELTKDTTLAEQLTILYRRLIILIERIIDTANLAGMEALSGTLVYYNAVKEAAKNNVDGAATIYEDLSKRFPSKRRKNTNDVTE